MICKNLKNNLGEKQSSENALKIVLSLEQKCGKFLQVAVTKYYSMKSQKVWF